MSYGTRGKYAEGKVLAALKVLSKRADFACARYPDPRAGSLKSAPADFEALFRGNHFKIEVKEVDHEFRLPRQNFPVMQRNRMIMWKHAGAGTPVIVYFKPLKLWRFADVSWFTGDETKSWDMRELPTRTLEECLYLIFNL